MAGQSDIPSQNTRAITGGGIIPPPSNQVIQNGSAPSVPGFVISAYGTLPPNAFDYWFTPPSGNGGGPLSDAVNAFFVIPTGFNFVLRDVYVSVSTQCNPNTYTGSYLTTPQGGISSINNFPNVCLTIFVNQSATDIKDVALVNGAYEDYRVPVNMPFNAGDAIEVRVHRDPLEPAAAPQNYGQTLNQTKDRFIMCHGHLIPDLGSIAADAVLTRAPVPVSF